MQNSTKNIFTGLDQDTDNRYVSQSSYVIGENIRLYPSADNKQSYIGNIAGNEYIGESQDGIVVGKCKDYQNGFIYFFVAAKNISGLNKDYILKLDCNTNTVSVLIQSIYLFPKYREYGILDNGVNPSVSATIYDNQLFWCDGTNDEWSHPPRFLNINLASEINSITTDISDLISVSLVTPLYPLSCDVITDIVNDSFNYLNNYSYQFTYRFIYENGAKSRFAPISKLAVTGYNQKNQFPISITITYGDKIQYLMVGSDNVLFTTIKYIEFAFRENYNNDFKVFKKISYPNNDGFTSPLSISFFGNEAYNVVNESEYIAEYDNVPLLANTCQYADTRTFWGNYKQERYKLNVWSENGGIDYVLNYTPKINSQALKLGSKYKYALDFIDHFGKRTTSYVSGETIYPSSNQVNIDVNASINTTYQDGLLTSLEAQKVTINLESIPLDIETIEIRRSNNLTYERFIQGRIEHAYYKTATNLNGDPIFIKGPDFTTTNYSTYNYVANRNQTNAGALELYIDISNWIQSGINYTFAPGDKVRVLTLNNNDTPVLNRTEDYTIIRQEGDILIASIESKQDNNCILSLRDGSNIVTNLVSSCMVGDKGGIWFKLATDSSLKKISKNNSVGWKSVYENINFYGCATGIYGDGDTSLTLNRFYVCGEGSILLSIVYNSTTDLFTITEHQQYDISKPTYRSMSCCTVQSSRFFMIITGDKNSDGNATVMIDYRSYSTPNPILTDISNDLLIKANSNKVSASLYFKDYDIVPIPLDSGSVMPIYISTDDNKYIARLNLSQTNFNTTLNSGFTYQNLGTANTSLWTNQKIASLYNRKIKSCATVGRAKLVNATDYAYFVGENGLSLIITYDGTSFSLNVSDVVMDYTWNDICVNQHQIFNNNDRPWFFCVGTNGYTFTRIINQSISDPNIDTLRIFQDVTYSSQYILSCVFNYVNGSDFRIFTFCGQNNASGFFAQETYTNKTFSVIPIETNELVLNYGAMIEVYTPASLLSEQTYYEIGYSRNLREFNNETGILDIDNNGTINLILGDGNVNSIPTYENVGDGDCFVINKKYYGRLWRHNEDVILSMTPNGSTDTLWNKDIGRPNIEDLTINFASTLNETLIPFREFTSNIIFSNPYIQGTKTNGLQTFEFLNYKQLPIEYGFICSLQVANNTNEDGTIMLSIHKRERVSIYIGKVQFSDVAGNNTIALSDQILGSFRTVNGSLGSVHKESICQYNSFIYGFDALKGVVWRYGQNGSTRLSDFGMRNFFYALGEARINDSEKNIYQKVISEYNPYYDEVIFTFMTNSDTYNYPPLNQNSSFSIIWSERLNRWSSINWATSSDSLPVLSHASMYQNMYSAYISDSKVMIDKHDSINEICNTFYGYPQVSSLVRFIINQNIDMVKNWENIRLQTDELWDASISNELNQNTAMFGEEDEIQNTNGYWRKLENNYYAPIMRNIKDGNVFTGDPLKSQILIVTLTLNNAKLISKGLSTKIVKIYDAIIRFSVSFR